MPTAARLRMSEEQYLAAERAGTARHEFVNGQAYAMVGGTALHARLIANVTGSLWHRLKGRSCMPYSGDLRLHIPETGLYTYPDLMVICGPVALLDGHGDTVLNPSLVVEVLSPSTESYDRGQKFAHYRRVPSLQGYLLVSQERRSLELFTRRDSEWSLRDVVAEDGALELPFVDCALPLAEVYDGIELPELPALREELPQR